MKMRWIVVSLCVFPALTTRTSAQILPDGASATLLATGFNFTEGPVYDGNGGMLFTNLNFGNQNASDIIRYDIALGTTQNVDPNSGGANGLYRHPNGQIVSADQGIHQISLRSAADITDVESVLADEWNGNGFNSPNDLVIAANGGIYFTDPDYNNVNAQPEAVYYRNSAGTVQRILADFDRPNGIMLSPDEQTLYLAVEQEFRIMAYDVGANGLPTNEREFAKTNVNANGNPLPGINNGPDGMTRDIFGNLSAAVQNAVFAWRPDGSRLFDLPVGQNPTNVAFGPDNKTLYITAGNSLYNVVLNIFPGDSDADGDVDLDDFDTLSANYGQTTTQGALAGDYNDDGIVNIADFAIQSLNMGTGDADESLASLPEPATGVVFMTALVFAGRGHRRYSVARHEREAA